VPASEAPDAASRDFAREIVIAHAWNSTSYQILNPGMQYWFSAAHSAVVGYTRRDHMLLAAGSPICSPEALLSVCSEFEAFAKAQGCGVCYVCAEERLRAVLLAASRYAAIAVGAQPVWNPHTWPAMVRHRASLRAQLHRAKNKGVEVEMVATQSAARDLELRRVLGEWLEGRRLPPLHFLVEPNVLDGELADRIVLLARRRGVPVAFLVASPIPARNGYLVELLARSPRSPNGASELLIDAAMRQFAGEGCDYATLGLVALAHAADGEILHNPGWLRMLMFFARAHANRFYNFRGLEHFRVKMAPDRWEAIYAISNEPRFSIRSLYAMGGAFSGISPWAAIALGIVRAAGDEFGLMLRHMRRLAFRAP
jgi:phosphatidylglycerol lysyltransferase